MTSDKPVLGVSGGMVEWVVCWPWHLRFMDGRDVHPKGAQCCDCRKDIAQYPGAGVPICLYCAMDRGLVEEELRPIERFNQFPLPALRSAEPRPETDSDRPKRTEHEGNGE